MQREHRDPGCNKGHDEVFVQRVPFSEDGKMKEHDRKELAGFGEDEGYVVDVV